MADRKISHAKGKGSLNHNNRSFIYKNVDPTKTKDNICYTCESLDTAYQKCFSEALSDYNAKQKRADRKIEDYYRHLFGNSGKDTVATSSNKEKSFYEIVVGIGDMNTNPVGSAEGDIAAKALDEYARGFSERNPNFYVFNSVMHLDEKTPHLHIDYIPVAGGYKNGMETRNSISVALQQMGFGKNKNSINEWRIRERKILRAICEKYGLEISEETPGRGKTYTPDEYKDMRDETKEELRTDTGLMNEVREDYISENKTELVNEAQKQAEKDITEIKNTLLEETRRIEGRIASEKRINAMADGIKETTLFGKTTVTIKFDGTAEQAMTVLNAAKERDNARKVKDRALADKEKAVKEKDDAVKAKKQAEKQKADMEKKAAASEATAAAELKKAGALKSEAAVEMKKAKDLYSQQTNLNRAYHQAVSDRDGFMVKANKTDKLAEGLDAAYQSIGAMAKAVCSLLYDPELKIENLPPKQERVLQAIRSYAKDWAETAGFNHVAEDIQKHYGISKGIQNHIDELTPKPPMRNKSYDWGR